jgi:hypothetical protein
MNFFRNYRLIKLTSKNNKDFIDKYLRSYFFIEDNANLNTVLFNKMVIDYSANDLSSKYKILLSLIKNLQIKSRTTNGLPIDYRYLYDDGDNLIYKDLFQINLWFFLYKILNKKVIDYILNSDLYKILKKDRNFIRSYNPNDQREIYERLSYGSIEIHQDRREYDYRLESQLHNAYIDLIKYYQIDDFIKWYDESLILNASILNGYSKFFCPRDNCFIDLQGEKKILVNNTKTFITKNITLNYGDIVEIIV